MTDDDPDKALRPKKIKEFIGQEQIKDNLLIAIDAAKQRNEVLDHVLFSGPGGLGKTTLSHIIAEEMEANIECTSGPAIEKTGDLAGILMKLERGDILFIDEIHRLRIEAEEFIYSAMEDREISITIGNGTNAKSMKLAVKPFTLVGATTREDILTKSFRDRFHIKETLELYSQEESIRIAQRSAPLLGVELHDEGARYIALASRGVPRKINAFMRRFRDIAQLKNNSIIDKEVAKEGLLRAGIDNYGLDKEERKILELLAKKPKGVGLKTLARTLNLGDQAIEQVYEPFLLAEGLIAITNSGRVITSKGHDVVGKRISLFN